VQANPCATPGATYLEHFVQDSLSNCGAIPDEIIKINPDGTINVPAGSHSCIAMTTNGCSAQNSGCAGRVSDLDCTITSYITYASDGSGATGLETAHCEAISGGSCSAIYLVTVTRQ
jgi:hypothetical protein